MKITHIHIERFRGFQNEDFEVGSLLTAIAGQNGTQKSTLLGIITQTFTLKTEDSMRVEKPLCGGSYISAFKDKFRLSPTLNQKVMNGLFPLMQEWMILLLKVSNEQEILMSVFGKKELGKKEMDTFPSPQSF